MDPIAITAASMQTDLQRMNVIANNSANALTPGFRREMLAVAGQFDAAPSGGAFGAASYPSTLPVTYTTFDNTPGAPRQTSNPLDLALLSDGFFEVSTPHGPAYTRQGAFRLDPQGRLVTQAGFPVAGVGGDILLSGGTPVIDREGKVIENGKQIAQIKVTGFERGIQLRNIGGGMYMTANNEAGREVALPRLAQGQLESSNVDSAREMVKMVETFRHFESSTRVLQAYDDLRDKAFRALGQF